jgi:hypothetical protein
LYSGCSRSFYSKEEEEENNEMYTHTHTHRGEREREREREREKQREILRLYQVLNSHWYNMGLLTIFPMTILQKRS